MLSRLNKITNCSIIKQSRQLITSASLRTDESVDTHVTKREVKESTRIKQFHEKLKLQPIPRVSPRERFVDLVLVEVDPNSGELIANSEEDPTKWGDWQNGGRRTGTDIAFGMRTYYY